jgi:hypothetical protein
MLVGSKGGKEANGEGRECEATPGRENKETGSNCEYSVEKIRASSRNQTGQ